jgi:hypothetical protein
MFKIAATLAAALAAALVRKLQAFETISKPRS